MISLIFKKTSSSVKGFYDFLLTVGASSNDLITGLGELYLGLL